MTGINNLSAFTKREALKLTQRGVSRRHIVSTLMNVHSRCVFSITIGVYIEK